MAGQQPLTEAAIRSEEDTFTNARLWDYRPLQTTLDQLQAVRQYYDFHDVDTDRYMIDGTLRQVMLSGRELAIDRDPDAPNWVNQRVIKTHGIGVAMTPVNEVTPEGQPRLWIRDLPPTSNSGAPDITQPRIYFGESDSHYVVVRAKQPEFDYPSSSRENAVDPTTSWTGQTGVPLDSTLSKLLFAFRFRDFDLLDHRPGPGRQPAAVPPDAVRAAGHDRAVPALRQGSVPGRRRRPARLRPGRVHGQRPVPERVVVRHRHARRRVGPRRRGHQLHPQQREDHRRRVRRHDALLRRRSRPSP